MAEDILIRLADREDVSAIAALEAACFSMPHSADQLLRELGDGLHRNLIAEKGGSFAGFAQITVITDEGYIGNIAVSEEFRRQGIAHRLMEALDKTGEGEHLSFISLEVRENNKSAIALYEKHGYTLQGRLKNYYSSPVENALIYTKFFQRNIE